MQPSVKQILTETPTQDGRPLFANAAKLGEAVAAASPKKYKQPKTTAALITFVFRKDRACTEHLRAIILAVTKSRLVGVSSQLQADWVSRVGHAIDFHNASFAKKRANTLHSDDEEFDRLLMESKTAEEHFIITPLTAEQERDISRAQQLTRTLLERLSLTEKAREPEKTKYKFLLPSEETIEIFWKNLFSEALQTAGDRADRSWLKKRLIALEADEHLRVYLVPSYICGCPIVVFNPTSRFASAFSFGYNENNVVNVIEWHFKEIGEWAKNVFKAFKPVESECPKIPKAEFKNFFGYRSNKFLNDLD